MRPARFLLRKACDEVHGALRAAVDRAGGSPYAPRWSGPAEVAPLLSAHEIVRALAVLGRRRPADLEEIHRRADRIASGERRVLGVRLAEPPAGSAWHRDVVSGRTWPVKFHTRYAYAELLDRGNPSDVKVPWELSRLQHLPVLALAYRSSGEERLLRAILDDVAAWRHANPVGEGVNWTTGMEVAFRAVSLLLTNDLVAGTSGAAHLEGLDLPGLLAAHGRYLYRNPEYSDINGNHYTSCLLGLLVLGLALPSEREAGRWVELAVRELRREILAQTYADGVCHEGSIPYHGLVLELFLAAELFARRRGLDLGAGFRERLARMAEFVHAYTKPNGSAPLWGDNDDGRLVHISARSVSDHRALQVGCAVVVGRPDLATADDLPGLADVIVLFDGEALDALEALPGPSVGSAPAPESAGFDRGGFYVLRRRSDYCLIDCGDVGLRGRGGHGHHDALSIEVSLDGVDVLTDTGSSSYTRSLEERLRSISAASHNVAMLGGREPAPFSLARVAHAGPVPVEVLRWDPGWPAFTGRHLGWDPVSYERRVVLESASTGAGGRLLVEDSLRSRLEDHPAEEIVWRFHFAEPWRPCELERGKALLEDSVDRRLRLELRLEPPAPAPEASFEPALRYRAYGQPSKRWALSVRRPAGPLPVVATFRLWLVGLAAVDEVAYSEAVRSPRGRSSRHLSPHPAPVTLRCAV